MKLKLSEIKTIDDLLIEIRNIHKYIINTDHVGWSQIRTENPVSTKNLNRICNLAQENGILMGWNMGELFYHKETMF